MKRVCLVIFLSTLTSLATAQNVKVKFRAALYDRDLNLKPVPHLSLKLVPAASGLPTATVQTNFDGVAETEVLAGKYKVISDKPVELFDKSYRWELDADFSKPENSIELSNDNAQTTLLAGGREAHIDELAFQYKRVKDAAITVWTEHGSYDGIVVDPAGLILTTQKPVETTKWLAVQIDDHRRLPATVLSTDKDHDLAVLRINPTAGDAISSAQLSTDAGSLIEGERVFTIENPDQDKNKKLITGVISKVNSDEIVSDVKILYGCALFNSSGNIVGIARTRDQKPVIQPIGNATSALAEAKQKLATSTLPSPQLMPSPPTDKFAFEGLRAPGRDRWEKDTYSFQVGDFYVEFFTPVALYEAATERYDHAMKEYAKHSKGQSPPQEPEYKYDPVLAIAMVPKTKTPFWENMASGSGGRGPIIQRYKNGFEKARVLCGDKELTPIWPGLATAGGGYGRGSVLVDESSLGRYVYTHDALTPDCAKITLQIFSAKDPDHPLEKVLDPNMVTRFWKDFEPYRKTLTQHANTAQTQ